MNSKELLIKAKETAEKQLELAGQIEDAEYTIEAAKKGNVCFYVQGTGTVNIAGVTDPEKLEVIKDMAMVAIMNYRDDRTKELKKLLGPWKPAIINQEFEAAVQEMEQSNKDPVADKLSEILQTESDRIYVKPPLNELEVDNVRRMYHDEAKTMKEIAEYYGVTKTRMNSYISKYNLRRTSYNKASYSDPVDNKKPKPEPLRAQSNVKKCRVCGKNIIINPKMAWAYKYGRKQNGKVETAYCCSRECLGIGKMKDA